MEKLKRELKYAVSKQKLLVALRKWQRTGASRRISLYQLAKNLSCSRQVLANLQKRLAKKSKKNASKIAVLAKVKKFSAKKHPKKNTQPIFSSFFSTDEGCGGKSSSISPRTLRRLVQDLRATRRNGTAAFWRKWKDEHPNQEITEEQQKSLTISSQSW